jgi:hypothetical protein
VLTDGWTQLRYHALQARLWRTKARYVAVAAGRGSGKTELARRRVVRFLPVKKPWPDPIYFYALPTMGQAKRVAWRSIKRLVPKDWLIKEPNESAMTIETVFGSMLQVIGLDKPMRVEGMQWDGGVIDESCDQKPGSFDLTFLPMFSHRTAWCWRIGVPKRYGVGATEFKEVFKKWQEDDDPNTESYTWPSEDILTGEELLWAREHLDPRDFNEQYNASWEDASGAVFYAFSDVHNVSDLVCYDPSRPLCIGSDFNVDPMAWVVGHRCDSRVDVFDELFLRNTNTQRTLDELYRRYGRHESGFEFYGDATGRARKTSASITDYVQIRNDRRFHGARVFYPRSNPPVVDRFASCNAMFCNATGDRRCVIHPRCKNLISDLNARSYKEGLREPEDYGDIGHITDALGYWIHRRFPVRLDPNAKAPHVHTEIQE